VIMLDFDPQFGIGKADPIARGRTEHFRVSIS
jgi:hypothetical protein